MSVNDFYIPVPFLNKITKDKTTEGSHFFRRIRTLKKYHNFYHYLIALSHLTKLLVKKKESGHVLTFKVDDTDYFFEGLRKKEMIKIVKGLELLTKNGELSQSFSEKNGVKYVSYHCHFFKSEQRNPYRKYWILNKFTDRLNECIRILGGPAKSSELLILFLFYIKFKYNESKYFASETYMNGFGRSSFYSRMRLRTQCESMLRKQIKVFNSVFKTNLKVISDTSRGIIKTGMRLVFDGIKKELKKFGLIKEMGRGTLAREARDKKYNYKFKKRKLRNVEEVPKVSFGDFAGIVPLPDDPSDYYKS